MPSAPPNTRGASWPITESRVVSGFACTARCRSTPGSGRARSSPWPSRGRLPSCTASSRTRPRWREPLDAARRSAVGTWTFAGGGLVVEGGRRRGRDDCGPLARPPAVSSFLALRRRRSRLARRVSAAATRRRRSRRSLRRPSSDVEHVAHLVLMALLPAVADADIDTFGAALTEIQEVTGRWFAAVQGGTFAPGQRGGPAHDARLRRIGSGPELVGTCRVRDRGRRRRRRAACRSRARGIGPPVRRVRGRLSQPRRTYQAWAS